MATTIDITLPDDVNAFVEREAARRGFASASEFVQSIVRDAQTREAMREQVDALLIEGLDSGPATPLTSSDWEHIRREGKAQLAQHDRRQEYTAQSSSGRERRRISSTVMPISASKRVR